MFSNDEEVIVLRDYYNYRLIDVIMFKCIFTTLLGLMKAEFLFPKRSAILQMVAVTHQKKKMIKDGQILRNSTPFLKSNPNFSQTNKASFCGSTLEPLP